MSENILWLIITGLFGVIIGGAGGQALIRRALKMPSDNSPGEADGPLGKKDDTVKALAAVASTAAEATASAFRLELNGHMTNFERQLVSTNTRLSNLEGNIQTLLGACPERHRSIEKRLNDLEIAVREK